MIIGISGKIGSGKTTVTNIIRKHHPEFEEKTYAFKLKLITSILTGTTIEQNLTHEGKNTFIPEWNMTLGRMQQLLGTEAIRNNLDQNAWIKALFIDYKEGDNWIITDCRFPNEIDAIKKHNGFVIRIEGDPMNERKNTTRDVNHKSEIALDNYKGFSYTIQNNGTLEELEKKILHLF